MDSEIEIVRKYEDLKKRADELGFAIKTDKFELFTIDNIPQSRGVLSFRTLDDMEMFFYGYEICKRIV